MTFSVKKTAEISRKYSYKMQVITCGRGRAFLSISDNFLRSPYPRHLTSAAASYNYVKKIFDETD